MVLSQPLSPINTSDIPPDGSVGMEDLQKVSFVCQAKGNSGKMRNWLRGVV